MVQKQPPGESHGVKGEPGDVVIDVPNTRVAETNDTLLQEIPQSRRITISWHLSAFVPVLVTPGVKGSGGQNPFKGVELPWTNRDENNHAPKERQVLFNVGGTVQPGQMLALMGPSGSGKSSLLSILGSRSTARVTGSILFNGKPMNKAMKRNMGFVTQDDLLYAELTTFETLYYAALLRLPRQWTKQEKLERVEMVLQALGLSKARDTIIGNHSMRGVSGGERKRVSIGHELLINPSVIMLDEPTSGLDSTTALKLIHTLRSLASGGRTIIASIHQPSSRLYQEMDQLMLLSEGRVMYYGEANAAAAAWFDRQNVPVPFGVSIPDHLLDLANGVLPDQPTADPKQAMQQLVTAFTIRDIGKGPEGVQPSDFSFDTIDAQPVAPVSTFRATPPPSSLGDTYTDQDVAIIDMRTAAVSKAASVYSEAPSTAAAVESTKGATWFQQLSILTSRCLRVRRFQALSVQRVAEVIIVAILAGLFWFQRGGTDTLNKRSISDISGLLFFQMIYMSFSIMFQAILTFPSDSKMLIKERQSGMYRLTAYYFSRAVSDVPMDSLVPTIFCIIIYFMAGLRLSAGAFFCNWLTMLLTMLVAQSVGLFIGATINDPKTAMTLTTVFMLCSMLVAGFYVQNIPIWIRWLRYVSFIYYGFTMLLKIEFNHRGYDCAEYYQSNPDAPPGQTWCEVNDSGQLPTDVDKPVTLEVCLLIAMLIVARVVVYLALRHKTTFKTNKIKSA